MAAEVTHLRSHTQSADETKIKFSNPGQIGTHDSEAKGCLLFPLPRAGHVPTLTLTAFQGPVA